MTEEARLQLQRAAEWVTGRASGRFTKRACAVSGHHAPRDLRRGCRDSRYGLTIVRGVPP